MKTLIGPVALGLSAAFAWKSLGFDPSINIEAIYIGGWMIVAYFIGLADYKLNGK